MQPGTLIYGSLAGVASALLVLTASSGPLGLLLGYLAPLPLLFAGLTKGAGAAALAALAGTVASGVHGALTAGMFALMFGLPAAWLTRMALLARPAAEAGSGAEISGDLEWYPPGRLVLWMMGWVLALFALALVLTTGNEGGLPGTIKPMLAQFFTALQGSGQPVPGGGDPQAMAETLSKMMPAVMAASWLLMTAVNGTLAQGLAALLKQNRRPTPHYSALTLPRFLAISLAAALGLALVLPADMAFIAATVAAVLAFAYFLQGLAVVHALAAKAPASGFVLAAFYAALVIAAALVGSVVVILGLIEEWAGFRRRVAGAGASREKE